MARLTATEVIELGEYLEPDFDPNELTVPHLISILTLHGVRYPTPYNKSKLLQAFFDEIKPHAAQFKNERLKQKGSVASSRGITDGMSGRSLSDDEPQEQPQPRRSSRRLSKPPSQTVAPSKPYPPKRRRSSAEPALSRTSSRALAPQEPALAEESEEDDEPVKKIGRLKKSAAAGTQGRRVSQADDVEGWSDNNVFQSGAESSSPSRPPAGGRPSRRLARKGRTSMSAPPQIPSSSPFYQPPSSSTFDPQIPAGLPRHKLKQHDEIPRTVRPSIPKVEERLSSPLLEEDTNGPAAATSDEDLDVKLNARISQTIANGGSERAVTRQDAPHPQQTRTPIWQRIVMGIFILTFIGIVGSYKVDSASIGYCHPGTSTNSILKERQLARMAAQECTERLAQHSNEGGGTLNISCTPLPLIPLPEPKSCTPCPPHAYCTPHTVTCDQSFVLRKSLLAHVPYLPELLNGLPGLGPVALPPSCVEDEERRRNIGRLGGALEHYLAVIRGQRLCMGVSGPPGDGGEAAQWGVDVDRVHDHLKRVTVVQKKAVKGDEFESLFKQAISDLQRYGYVIASEDSSGAKYIAALRTHLDLPCRIRVGARDTWNEWKAHIFGTTLLLISAYWIKNKVNLRRTESRRIADLVQVVLDALRNQESAHAADPTSAPHSYVSSLHLRDSILQDVHSIPTRRRLWEKVEKVVEGNTNVRASMEELAGGDEGRVWRWVGGARAKSAKAVQ